MDQTVAELLDSLAKRPAMYVGTVSFATVRSFLSGLKTGLQYAGIDYTWEDYHAASEACGFDPRGNIGVLRDFQAKRLSNEEMVQALIVIEAAAFAKALARRNLQE